MKLTAAQIKNNKKMKGVRFMEHVDPSKYRVRKPYPNVDNECHNKYYAELIKDDYASRDSEYTAISQYIFAHVMTDNEEIAKTFLGIAIVEMNHLDMLADLIKDLGSVPIFRSGDNEIWNSNFVPYGTSTKDRILLGIKAEKGAIAQYEQHIRKIDDKDIRELLERIIMDEELHIKIFEELLKKYY